MRACEIPMLRNLPEWAAFALSLTAFLCLGIGFLRLIVHLGKKDTAWGALTPLNLPVRRLGRKWRCPRVKIGDQRMAMTLAAHGDYCVFIPSILLRLSGDTARMVRFEDIRLGILGTGQLKAGGKWHELEIRPAHVFQDLKKHRSSR